MERANDSGPFTRYIEIPAGKCNYRREGLWILNIKSKAFSTSLSSSLFLPFQREIKRDLKGEFREIFKQGV